MKWIADTVASLVAHGAIIGAVSAIHVWTVPQERSIEIPISFEFVEESGLASSQETANEERETPAKPEEDEPAEEVVDDIDPALDDIAMEAQEAVIEEPRQMDVQEQTPEPDPVPHPKPDRELVDAQEVQMENEPQPEERARIDPTPVAIGRIVPAYPRRARRKGHEGAVVVEIDVGADGKVGDVAVVESSGYDELDESAVAAVRTASFAPATEDGKGVRGRLRLTFEFKLR